VLLSLPAVARFFSGTPDGRAAAEQLASLGSKGAYLLALLPTIGQEHVLQRRPLKKANNHGNGNGNGNGHHLGLSEESAARAALVASLEPVEDFYDSLGGLLGYQLQCLRLAAQAEEGGGPGGDAAVAAAAAEMLVPVGLDISDSSSQDQVVLAVAAGLEALPHMAEIYPLGGAGDRLGLRCDDTGEDLPAAVLPYCGRPLLETLIRDLQAREYLHFKVHGEPQLTTPVAIMTSAAKGNHRRVEALCDRSGWFGRGRDAFRLFMQPLVPVIDADDGRWLLGSEMVPLMKPGGHGAIWKLMRDAGIFEWLGGSERTAAVIRQISNPMAGQDSTLLVLAGAGFSGRRAFGFASCERAVGASEGMNVLLRQRLPDGRHSMCVTNVEYTEFERLGISDTPAAADIAAGPALSAFPANTNVLYVGLPQLERTVAAAVAAGSAEALLPGMLLNRSKECTHRCPITGEERRVRAARLECTMQNMAEQLAVAFDQQLTPQEATDALPTFIIRGPRRRVTSSAKRRLVPGAASIRQTPDGSFYDLMVNARELLQMCGFDVPEVGEEATYLASGPGMMFLYHPALGPLWDVVAQKVRGGRLAPRAELQLEVAEACVEELDLDGSLLVTADSPLGRAAPDGGYGMLQYGNAFGQVRLHNVIIRNAGVDWSDSRNVYWQHSVARKEACRVVLQGRSEFDARDVEIAGDATFDVPDGFRMTVRRSTNGGVETALQPLVNELPSWCWEYRASQDGRIALELRE
jgi:UTP---glucose-1-phosphate uridylyltransferase